MKYNFISALLFDVKPKPKRDYVWPMDVLFLEIPHRLLPRYTWESESHLMVKCDDIKSNVEQLINIVFVSELTELLCSLLPTKTPSRAASWPNCKFTWKVKVFSSYKELHYTHKKDSTQSLAVRLYGFVLSYLQILVQFTFFTMIIWFEIV